MRENRSGRHGLKGGWAGRMVKVVQITDSHLGQVKPHFAGNWEPLVAWIEEQEPDLIIHSGDVTVDGADEDDDLSFCAERLRALPAPVLVVPGNHDVGEPHHPRQPVDERRLTRWRTHFGPDRWTHDLERWRLVGLNSMIMGSGLADEEEQFVWLEEAMASAEGRRICWVLHQPLFIGSFDEGDNGYWSVQEAPRARLRAMAEQHDVAFVASGHLHRSHQFQDGGIGYLWCPSSAFAVGPKLQPVYPGTQELGAAIHEFSGSEVRSKRVAIAGLEPLWIDDVVHEVYPS